MLYAKRGGLIVLFLLLSVSVALAAHTPSVSSDSVSLYETTSANISFTVSNSLLSPSAIGEVSFFLNNFNILSVFDIGWEVDANNSVATFTTDHDRIGRWSSQNFGVEVSAGNVDSNQTVDWVITTTDTAGDSEQSTIQATIINDDTAPVISDVVPVDGSFVKQGTSDQQFSLTASDPETGVAVVSGTYGLCGNLSNSLLFTTNGDSYSTTADLSSYDDSTVLCYRYLATSNGGESASVQGSVTIDGVPPQVALNYPDNGVLMNNNSLFQFTATDNLAPTMDCAIYVDGEQRDSVVANNGESAEISVDSIPEGEHSWNVTCSDIAGNEGTSETRTFILDKTSPVINVTSPVNGAVNKAGVPVEVTVTDNYGVDEVWYEFLNQTVTGVGNIFTIDTENATDGPNPITIHATDEAGNDAVLDYVMIVDRQGPSIELISPVENSTSDVHVPFILTVTDNYDPLLDCTVLVDGQPAAAFTAENGNVTDQTVPIHFGNWSISVMCQDDAENSNQTDPISIEVVDLTGPDISIEPISSVIRGETVYFTANITDFSGVDSATAVLIFPDSSSEPVTLTRNGDIFTGQYQTTADSQVGTYTLSVTANDTAGMDSTAMADFEVMNNYVITLSVTTPVYEGAEATASGTATRDDGEALPVTEIILVLPEENRSVTLDSSNAFSELFDAPSQGTYTIMAYVEINNRTFSATAPFKVNRQSTSSGHSSGSGGGHSTVVMHTTTSTPPDMECIDDSDCGGNEKCMDNQCLIVVTEEKEKLEPDKAEPTVNPNSAVNMTQQPGNGVGRAAGFLNLENIKWTSLLWIILAVAAIAIVMKMLAGKGKNRGRSRRNDFDIDKYLASRRR